MSIFKGPSRNRLTNIYLLLIGSQVPESRSGIHRKSGVVRSSNIFDYIVEKGLIKETTREVKGYMDPHRRGSKLVKAWYVVTDKGKEVIELYERLFDVLGFSEEVKRRKRGYYY